MMQLHEDKNFHYETIRSLGITRYAGSDIAETLAILPKIKPGNFDDWYNEWSNLAWRVLSTVKDSHSAVSKREAYLRASHYFFNADFFLHAHPEDPRCGKMFELWREYFDKANALLPIPGVHATVKTEHGFEVPILVYRAAEASAQNPRPTLIIGGGFDSNYEETLHVFGFAALERGYNVVLYEGPGQPRLLHEQGEGFVYDWEKAVTPVVDYLLGQKSALPFIDTDKLGLIGMSLGGYLSARAAAFEPRLAAVVCLDGVWSYRDCYLNLFPELKKAWEAGDEPAFNAAFDALGNSDQPTGNRWIHDHSLYSFQAKTGWEVMQTAKHMDMASCAHQIKMPAFIGEAVADIFFQGQPAKIAEAIGKNATLNDFGGYSQAAEAHCQSGALTYMNQEVFEWFANVVGDRRG